MHYDMIDDEEKKAIEKLDYFDLFESIADCSLRQADLLLELIDGYEGPQAARERFEQAHGIEHEADVLVVHIVQKADADFLPPIEREDIVELAMALDDVCDQIEKVVKHLYMYDVHTIESPAVEMFKRVREECALAKDSMKYFREFKKPEQLRSRASEIDSIERTIDDSFVEAIHELFSDINDTERVVKWRLLYESIERCSDVIDHAVDLMVRIVVKNG